jgi:hypothetical protein
VVAADDEVAREPLHTLRNELHVVSGRYQLLQRRQERLLAALDALVTKWDQESAAGRVYAARLAAELATHRAP